MENTNGHNLFNEYDPTLEYRSYFRYSRIPANSIDDSSLPVKKEDSSTIKSLVSLLIIVFGYFLVLSTFPISGWFAVKRVKALQRCLVYRLGERRALKGPGLIFVLPCIDSIDFIDLAKHEFTVMKDETLLTSDGSLIEIQQFRVTISVSNAIKSFTKLKDSHSSVKEFVQVTFKNLISSSKVEDLEIKLDSLISAFTSDCNFYLNNWGWHMDTIELPTIIVKTRAEQKNPIVSVLKNFFNPSSSEVSSEALSGSQVLINSLYGPIMAEACSSHQCASSSATPTSTKISDEFNEDFITRLENVPPRYVHMNIFNYERFNIKITIGDKCAFFVYNVSERKIAMVNHIEEAIHFDLKCRTFNDFFLFTNSNDTSKIEITTKLF